MKLHVLPPSGVPLSVSDLAAGLCGAVHNRDRIEHFKTDICRYFNVDHCFVVSSGRGGLSLLLQALHRLNPGRDQVALPAFTSYSVPSAVAHAGLKISLYDLDRQTLSPDSTSLRSIINERTLCIVVCHLFGYPCDMDAVSVITDEYDVPIVDDAAQAMGATYRDRLVGTMGLAGLFSLSRGKNISTVDGGIVVCGSHDLASAIKSLHVGAIGTVAKMSLIMKAAALTFLMHPRCYWLPAQLPFLNIGASLYGPAFRVLRYSSFQAVIGRRMLGRLDEINRTRRKNALELMQRLEKYFDFISVVPGADPVFLRLPAFPKRKVSMPREYGIGFSYPLPVNEIPGVAPLLVNPGTSYPVAKHLSESLVTLPTHHYMSGQTIEKLAQVFENDRL